MISYCFWYVILLTGIWVPQGGSLFAALQYPERIYTRDTICLDGRMDRAASWDGYRYVHACFPYVYHMYTIYGDILAV